MLKNQNPDGSIKLKNAPPKEKKEETPKKRRVKKNG